MKEELILMSKQDIDRYRVIRQTIEKTLEQSKAAEILDLTVRQVRNIANRVKVEGSDGVIHRLRGHPSNNRLKGSVVEKIKGLIKDRYSDFGPTLANEELETVHKIKVSAETVRQIMIREGYWEKRTMSAKHREWRERKERYGEMVQLDCSNHPWYEDRGDRSILIKYVDDATGKCQHAKLVNSENTEELLRSMWEYIKLHGRPISLYVDRSSIFKANLKRSDETGKTEKETQFSRAMRELGIKVIFAYSPQAKGRIERSYRTDQDRLVKKLRLAGINEDTGGNRYLQESYIDDYNRRFGREARKKEDLHRGLLREHDLGRILSVQTERLVREDFTIQHAGQFYQLEARQPVRVSSGIRVIVERHLDGKMVVRYKERRLNYHSISKEPHKPRFAVYPRYIGAYYKDSVFLKHSNAVRI